MKNPDVTVMDAAFTAYSEGWSNGRIQAELGLNYSQMWLDRQTRLMEAGDGRCELPKITVYENGVVRSDTVLAAQIGRAREADYSWGAIAVAMKMPESRVRRIFTNGTGLDSKGLRTHKGGRYVADDPRFYTGGDRAKLGTELDPIKPLLEQLPTEDEVARTLPTRVKVLETELKKANAKAKAAATRAAKKATKANA